MDNFDDAEMKCWGGSGLEPANTGGKWLRLLVHVSLCSMLFVTAPDRDPGQWTIHLHTVTQLLIYLTCGASELELVSLVTADRSSAFIKTSTLFMFMFCIGLTARR